jgi:hypothetical protein
MKKFQILFIPLLFYGCFFGPDGDSETLIGNYYISGDHGLKNVHLGFNDNEYGRIGLISGPLSAVGNNEEYIIVKRDSDKIEFFILKIVHTSQYSKAEENITGPLSHAEFVTQINELHLNEVKWSREY